MCILVDPMDSCTFWSNAATVFTGRAKRMYVGNKVKSYIAFQQVIKMASFQREVSHPHHPILGV